MIREILLILAAAMPALSLDRAPVLGADEWRALVCVGPTENIPHDDPALDLFREAEPDDIEARKVALAIERVNSCDEGEPR